MTIGCYVVSFCVLPRELWATVKKLKKLSTGLLRLKPSAHSTTFVAEDEDFRHWRRNLAVCGKQTSTIFGADDNPQYQTC